MLNIYSRSPALPTNNLVSPAADGARILWIDLIDPTEQERLRAAELIGMPLPTREETSAIELSSRLRSTQGGLRLNIPSFVRTDGAKGPITPLGFVLTPTLLATVRYAEARSFDQVAAAISKPGAPQSAVEVFVELIESIVGVGADHIESVAENMSKLSRVVFVDRRSHHRLLRDALFDVGAMQLQLSQIRLAVLGLARIISYLCENAPAWIDASLHGRFTSALADIGSLKEFEQQLDERLQFLLDAVLGFINNDQNDIIRVLTIVSVATVPPMILAGIWGMNFKSIPEYNWEHGYAFAWTMILLSMVIPLIGFRWKRWL